MIFHLVIFLFNVLKCSNSITNHEVSGFGRGKVIGTLGLLGAFGGFVFLIHSSRISNSHFKSVVLVCFA